MQLQPADPEWIRRTLLGTGDEAVQRHRHVQPELAHRADRANDYWCKSITREVIRTAQVCGERRSA